jgi:hypothetical protein
MKSFVYIRVQGNFVNEDTKKNISDILEYLSQGYTIISAIGTSTAIDYILGR